jgi:hypothetical protein
MNVGKTQTPKLFDSSNVFVKRDIRYVLNASDKAHDIDRSDDVNDRKNNGICNIN